MSGRVAVRYRTAGTETEQGVAERIQVNSVGLADVLASLPGAKCDFLKIDVEGAEYDMLLGLDDKDLQRVRRICLEYHEGITRYSRVDLERFFTDRAWYVRVHPNSVRAELGFLYAENPAIFGMTRERQ